MSDTHFYELTVKAIEAETDQAVVVTFEVPSDLKDKYTYKAGQYLTIKFDINGKEERRAYSLCSAPNIEQDLKIGIKRVKGGKVSNHVCDRIKAGDKIEVMPPQGLFLAKTNADNKKDYYLFGGGSGITPLLSILKTVAENEPKSRVFLYYQNKNEDSIMFKDELTALEKRYQGQVLVRHILDEPKTEKKGGMLGLFAKKIILWEGEVGRIDVKRSTKFINENQLGDGRVEEFYLCGPEGMMESVEAALKNKGIEDKYIHREVFLSSSKPASFGEGSTGGATVIATISGKQYTVVLKSKESILEGLMRIDADPPFSCMSGACSTCMAKVKSGTAKMERCLALDDSEVQQGYILTCSAIPTTDVVEITYDV